MTSKDYKVSINTWGTKHGNNKIKKQINTKLYGGNVGHAAIKLTFPMDERGKELISKYCMDQNNDPLIPYKEVISKDKILVFLKDRQGNILFDEKGIARKKIQEITSTHYEVYFSFWPQENSLFYLNDFKTDKEYERLGVNFEYPEENRPEFIEQRRNHGLLGARMITLGPGITINYPKMPASTNCTSLKQCRDLEIQREILSSTKQKEKLLAIDPDPNKLLVNFCIFFKIEGQQSAVSRK